MISNNEEKLQAWKCEKLLKLLATTLNCIFQTNSVIEKIYVNDISTKLISISNNKIKNLGVMYPREHLTTESASA